MFDSTKNLNILNLESSGFGKIKPVNLKFLYEFAAIPLSVRKEFMERLMTCRKTGKKRKNAHLRKNVRLLEIIYFHIAENTMLEWDENKICASLEISKDMLYCHKSWLLKGLRAYYFKWDESNDPKYTQNIFQNFERAEKQMRIGMRREAKCVFLNILNILSKRKRKSREELFLMFNSLKHLCDFYKSNRNYRKFIESYKSIEALAEKLLVQYPDKRSIIMMSIYICRAYRTNFHGKKTQAALESIECLKLAYEEAAKTNDIGETLQILCNLSGLLTAMNNKEQCVKFIEKGLNFARKNNLKLESIFFETLVDLNNLEPDNVNYNGIIEEIKSRHDFIRRIDEPSYFWYQRIMFALASLSTQLGSSLTSGILYEFTSKEIIFDGYDSSLRILYFMKFDHYLEKIKTLKLQKDPTTGKEIIVCKKTNAQFLRKQETSIFELIVNARKIQDAPFKRELYMYMLITDFWKGKNCSYEYSQHIMRQIDWIHKTSPQLKEVNKEILDISITGISLIYDSVYLSEKTLLKKYEIKFVRIIKNILTLPPSKALSFYCQLSFIAENSGNDIFKGLAIKAYNKLEHKYSDFFDNEKNKIRSRTSQEHSEYWSEEIAA